VAIKRLLEIRPFLWLLALGLFSLKIKMLYLFALAVFTIFPLEIQMTFKKKYIIFFKQAKIYENYFKNFRKST